ncbi:Mu-like prophage protein gp16 [Serratia ficaria]|uniref:gp16 family protein n=1 Tax=Serratia ficaria TaxID=61651 RepID=UPI00217BFE2C|nr:regulatory protein GemA [Serratia ficaria]CAI0904834.1 Mu-like prophage protein gp16 [Serratia ficaria]CAI1082659.1 Mu-like prophage protein gp16 [Serratia ficaria]CAI1599078.1 Mu-like prophage protein gp16 [Serratia ficaria]CAI2400256.1 Mu-like prophage protein gp16 [Serratia ficaria]CAI2497706.1 Mu-like prophage protein gp16 [Serratia ficaria]
MSRINLVKLIHVAKRDRRLDDDTYRQLLQSYTGLSSTKDMSVKQLEDVMEALYKLGFQRSFKRPGKITATDEQSKKIRSLWLEMSEAGFVRDSSERAINAYVHRITGVGRLEWLGTDQASRVIETLKKWQVREIRNLASSA